MIISHCSPALISLISFAVSFNLFTFLKVFYDRLPLLVTELEKLDLAHLHVMHIGNDQLLNKLVRSGQIHYS